MTDFEKVQRLMGLLRANVPQLGLLSVEVLLLCAEGPKTAAELERRTGAANGPVMRACWPFVTRATYGERKVIEAQLPLLKRTRKKGRAPLYLLSVNGWRLLKECGLM
jgi:hypothetical protein